MLDPNKAHYVVATAIVIKEGKYLIAKRSANEKVAPNEWTVPGGKMEQSDYTTRKKDTAVHWYNVCEHTVRREVKEEVGLEIANIRYLTSLAFVRPDGIPTIIISLFADHATGEVTLCKDLTDYKWVTLDEARNYKLIEGIFEELEMLDKHLKGKTIGEWKK